jgi:hypothetical protein
MMSALYRPLTIAYAAALLAVVVWFTVTFPIWRPELAAAFLVYAVLLWRQPRIWLYAIPALLPVFDLAPLSGRFFFDEFDALVLLTAGVLALRERDVGKSTLSSYSRWVLVLLCASYLVSAILRIWPPPAITADSFADYYSPYNSLRVAKGYAWVLLLIRPLGQANARGEDVTLLLCRGLLVGLAGVGIASLVERWLFTGVLTWVTTYRTTANFSSMHTGDGHIDVWLATTIPLLGVLIIDRRRLAIAPVTLGLAILSIYSLVVTESRGPLVALGVAMIVGALAFVARPKFTRGALIAIDTALVATIVFMTIGSNLLYQTSVGQRFSQTDADASIRWSHWRAALALRDDTLSAQLFGMGLGSFPEIHQTRSTSEKRAARFQFISNGSDHFLKLWSGQNIYMAQVIPATQHSAYKLKVRVRTSEPHAVLTVAWCELWMLYSANCTWDSFTLADTLSWQAYSKTIYTQAVGSGRHLGSLFVERPTKLTYFVANASQRGVDIGGISLEDSAGRELVENGDFAGGDDHWFWEVDDHLPWHTKNLAVNILFDQGWLGLLAVTALIVLTLGTLFRQLANDDPTAASLLAAMAGFLVTGLTVSTFDQPRLALMFYLICFAVLVKGSQPRPSATAGGLSPGEAIADHSIATK